MKDLAKAGHNLTYSFQTRPHVSFETQLEDEEVILVVRKHPLTQLQWVVNTLLLVVVGIFLGMAILPLFLASQYITVFYFFFVFFTFSYVWLNFLLWYFTVGIITNKRIIDLDFINVLYKEFTATTIEQVSDITTSVGGFFGSFFNFGDVMVKTQGFQQNIEFLDVPQPADIVEIINLLMRDIQDNP
jgi:hypothetical protein